MKIKKIIAGVAASALAVSTMAAAAFAVGTLTAGDGCEVDVSSGQWLFKGDGIGADINPADVYGVAIQITVDEALITGEDWLGGGIGVNSNSTQWANLDEFGKADKAILLDTTKTTQTLTYTSEEAIFTADEEYAGFWLQDWADGTAMTIDGMAALAADGSVIAQTGTVDLGGAAEEPAESETPAESEAPTTGDTSKPSTNTGAEGIAVAAGVAVLAAGAAVVAKKRK